MKMPGYRVKILLYTLFPLFPLFLAAQKDVIPDEIDPFVHTTEVCDQVIQVRTGWDAVTAIATPTQQGIVVIDAGISASLTALYRKAIEAAFQRNDFAYLINTHSHPDHTGGNQVFADAVIIGHQNCLTEIPQNWQDTARVKSRLSKIVKEYQAELDTLAEGSAEWEEALCNKICYASAYHDVSNGLIVTPPTLTFDDTLTIRSGDVTFCLIYFGKAHSASDIFIHIPEKKILLVGDLFSRYGRPSFRTGDKPDVEKWFYAMDWIKSRMPQIEIIIGGHGEMLSKDDLQDFDRIVRKKREETED